MEIYERIVQIALYKKIRTKRELIRTIIDKSLTLGRTGDIPSEKTLYSYLSGDRKMDSEFISSVAKILGVDESTIMSGTYHGKNVFFYNDEKGKYEYNPDGTDIKENDFTELSSGINIRKYDGAVGAGSFGVIDESFISETFLPYGIFSGNMPKNTKHLMAFEVAGDSMSPVIDERNWVIIDMVDGREYCPVDGIYLCNIDSSYQIKRLQFLGKRVKIISENPNYETIDSSDCDVFEVVGKLFTVIKIGSGLVLK